ncbi:Glyoxalase/Bleomycin resistance protein/Dioxygenase superfamily protein [Halomicrobium zhouii]|uniref:Glyoxalase/Bleomycin resistance protein/Dioxygenase superfamily protein n=1 Tax=Halomicrobium zhouii TaxID=767519 RepID=A0A1I6LQZ5_9EURY|nr:VOC family protein [Halomicrobium zhouii]SFS05915.1 Glyoxalase/Bleomycin resistance protein/Dioxygenase superfamily protein [Halomicrobium zhouii]
MLSTPRWLALEVKYLDRARSFYESALGLSVVREAEQEVAYDVGGPELRLRAPGDVPRGGLHTHYALSIPSGEYDDWYDRLDERFDLVEHRFGDARSLYFDDPDGHCVELAESDVDGPGVVGLFEVVLEVEELEPARVFYQRLGFEPIDYGDERRRVRMTGGDVDLELWEPQLGLADGRGGVHVDWGITAEDPTMTADRVTRDAQSIDETEAGIRIRDPDGHYLTLCEE